jgi:pimeloyl-ACP methyl ester carboxylesterase
VLDVPAVVVDPIVADPPGDLSPKASTRSLTFASGGARLPGVLLVPAGPGPHPIVVLLNGFPGNERNFDLAQALRRAGYATSVFYYRGSWGVAGAYSWNNVLEDAARVVEQMQDPGMCAENRLDAKRIAVIGHSLGGFAALMTAAANPGVAAVGSISGFDFGMVAVQCRLDPALRESYVEAWEGELLTLRGTSGEALVGEMEAAGSSWRLAGLAGRLTGRSVLLIGTGRDPVTPDHTHHRPVVEAYLEQRGLRLEHHVLDTDHSLSDHRVALARITISFLDQQLRNPR